MNPRQQDISGDSRSEALADSRQGTSRMTHTKVLVGQVVLGIVIGGVWFATEWTAARLAFQPGLGPASEQSKRTSPGLPLTICNRLVTIW